MYILVHFSMPVVEIGRQLPKFQKLSSVPSVFVGHSVSRIQVQDISFRIIVNGYWLKSTMSSSVNIVSVHSCRNLFSSLTNVVLVAVLTSDLVDNIFSATRFDAFFKVRNEYCHSFGGFVVTAMPPTFGCLLGSVIFSVAFARDPDID